MLIRILFRSWFPAWREHPHGAQNGPAFHTEDTSEVCVTFALSSYQTQPRMPVPEFTGRNVARIVASNHLNVI